MLVQSSYHGLSQYLGDPENNIIYKPENGKYSEEYFKKFKNFLDEVFNYKEHPLKISLKTQEMPTMILYITQLTINHFI